MGVVYVCIKPIIEIAAVYVCIKPIIEMAAVYVCIRPIIEMAAVYVCIKPIIEMGAVGKPMSNIRTQGLYVISEQGGVFEQPAWSVEYDLMVQMQTNMAD